LSKSENNALIQVNEEKVAADAIGAFLHYVIIWRRRYQTPDE